MTTKNDIRNRANELRIGISEYDFSEWSASICKRLLGLKELQKARRIHAFWPISAKGEVDIRPVISFLHSQGKHIYLPISNGEDLHHGLFTGESELRVGKFGVMEPIPNPDEVFPDMDIVLVPALAADLEGHRIGYGKGYYDRFLSRSHALKVVPIFEKQLVGGIPWEAHDVPVDMVVTERTIHLIN